MTRTYTLPYWVENSLFNSNCRSFRAAFDLHAYWLIDRLPYLED